MAPRINADSRGSATESKFYLPAGDSSSFDANPFERLWAGLFSHGVEPPE